MITFQKHFSRALPKYLKDNHHNSLHLTQKHAQVLVLSRDLSLPQSLQFSLRFALRKLFASLNR